MRQSPEISQNQVSESGLKDDDGLKDKEKLPKNSFILESL